MIRHVARGHLDVYVNIEDRREKFVMKLTKNCGTYDK